MISSGRFPFAAHMAEMRGRVDPQIALLPEGLAKLVRSSKDYHGPWGGGSGNDYTYSIERPVAACQILAERAGVTEPAGILPALEHPAPEVTYSYAILPYLSHPDPRWRFEAAFALGLAGCRKALPALREMAAADDEVRSLGSWDDTEMIEWIEAR